ncbi:MAG TPA: hypothetical protein VG013_30355 [Gemmataceae bacterium]|jgi:hypothetical protein|nr:hypothetical protein [Gemmataceae bacterium]
MNHQPSSGTPHGNGTTAPAHHGAAPGGQPYFPAAEWDMLQADDRRAATYIAGLMISIFILGLIGYICVAIWVA